MAKSRVSGTNGLNFTAKLDINEARRNALELQKLFRELNISTSQGFDAKPLTGYQQGMLNLKKALADSQRQTEELRQENLRLRNEYERGRITGQDYRTEISRINLARRQEVEAARLARRAQQEVAGSYAEAQKRLRDLGAEIRNSEGGFKRLTPELRAKIKEYNELNSALKAFDASMGNHQRNVGDYRGAIKSAASDLLGFASGYLSLGNALTYVFNQTLAFNRLKTPLNFILGSEGAADAKLVELKKLADELGLQYFTIANSYKSFIASAKASNFDLGASEKIFKSVAKASAVLGLSNEQLEGSFLAIQQMISKGNVQAEELRGQLSERLPGAFALAAKAMGVTEQELNKLLQTGQVVASDLLPKLADQLDKAYGDKAKNGINGLNSELNQLYSEIQSFAGQGSFLEKNLFEPIVRGAKNAVKTLRELVNGDGFVDFLKNATTFTGKEFRSRQDLYDLRAKNKSSNSSLVASQNTDYTAKNLKELRNSFQEADGAYKSAIRSLLDYNEKSKKANTDTKEEFKTQLSGLKTSAEGYRLERKRIGDALDQAKKQQVNANKEIADSALTSITQIRKRISELQKLSGSAVEGSALSNRIKALQDRLKGPSSSSLESEFKSQRALQSEIDALTKKGRAKRLSDDEQELADVDAKYKKLREKAIAFNNNPKNKAKGLRVDVGGLISAQSAEEDAVRDKQAASVLKSTLDQQKKYYEEFEQYKVTYGEEKAKERYAKLIDTDKTYLQKLKEMEEEILNPEKSKGADNLYDGKSEKQLKELRESISAETQAEQKKNDLLLKEFMDYSAKRKVLIENYNRDYAALGGNPDEQAERTRRYDQELKQLDDANAKKIDSYRELFTGIENLSRRSALKLLEQARVDFAKQIKSGKIIDPRQIAEIKTYFNDIENTIRNGSGQALIDLARQVDNVASEVGKLDESFGKIVGTLGNVLGQLGNVKSGISSIKIAQGKGDIFGQLTSGLGIFSAGLSIFQGIAGLFDKSVQREEQASYAREIQNKQTEALNKALERQVALLNDAYGTDRIKNYSDAIKQAQENQAKYAGDLTGKYILSGNKQLDDILTRINSGEGTGVFGLSVDSFVKTNQAALDKLKLPSDLNTLQRLLDEGKLDSNTSNIVINLIKAKETADQLLNSLRSETVGTSLEQVADDFISTLTDGTNDFGKTFEQTMQKSILNGFKGELIRKQLQAFYSQFAELSDGGLTSDEIETLRKNYISASEKAKKDIDDLSKATGINLSSQPSQTTSTPSNIISAASITEQTGNKLEGLIRGSYDVQKKTLNILTNSGKSLGDLFLITMDSFALQVKIEQNTFRTANNTDLLNTKLDAIITNTKPAKTSRDLGQ